MLHRPLQKRLPFEAAGDFFAEVVEGGDAEVDEVGGIAGNDAVAEEDAGGLCTICGAGGARFCEGPL